MVRRGLWWIVVACVTIGAAAFYLHYAYFFNPLSFAQSSITHLPWKWYKNPLQAEYAVLEQDGWKMLTVMDRAEISLIFQELQAGIDAAGGATLGGEGKPIWFGVRRQNDGAILLSAHGCEQDAACQVAADTVIPLTEPLQQLLAKRLQQARDSAVSQPLSDDGS